MGRTRIDILLTGKVRYTASMAFSTRIHTLLSHQCHDMLTEEIVSMTKLYLRIG